MERIDLEALKNTQLLTIRIKGWGNRAKCADPVALEAYLSLLNGKAAPSVVKIDADPEDKGKGKKKVKRVSASKQLVVSEPLDSMKEHMTKVKQCALRFAMPSFIRPGSFVVQRSNVESVDALLEKGMKELQEGYFPDFILDYPDAKNRAKNTPVESGGLGPLYLEKDYPAPEQLADRFKITWDWFAFAVPEGLPPEIRAKEEAKLKATYEQAAYEIRDALRVMFSKLIERAVDRLAPSEPGEKPKVFRDSLIGNLEQFFADFEARNIMKDQELAGLVERCKEIMTGVDPARLREDGAFREETQTKLEQIAKAIEPMIEDAKSRAFDFDA